MKHSNQLHKYIETELLLDRNSSAFRVVYAATVRYLGCGFKSIAEYHSILQKYVDFGQFDFSAADFRLSVSAVCKFVTNIRFYALSICLAKGERIQKTVLAYKDFGVSKTEAVLIWKLMLCDSRSRKILLTSAKAKHKTLCAAQVCAAELKERHKQTEILSKVLRPNVKRQVHKLLRWVSVSHNITLEDLSCDVMCKLIVSYYHSLPNSYSFDHQLNYLRRSLNNIINNMNYYYSAEKRNRMELVGDHYELIVMSNNQLRNTGGRDNDTEMNYEDLSEASDVENTQMENRITIDKLLKQNENKKRGRLYNAILGRDEKDLTDYLTTNNLLGKKMSSSTEWLVAKPINYIKKVLAKWLEVSVEAVDHGMNSLKSSLQIA